ncbi:Ribonuclease [Quillaja saponaria]|uniref:Ribonuclease n=1 Tax=Quillaja saponaria TaxID=32244 RepID=A0AAD7M6U3_QUISA|nr:Ribonuclease [Quillaja saponaria]
MKCNLRRRFLFLYLIVFVIIIILWFRPRPNAQKFDYFKLALQWPNSYCLLDYVTCRPAEPPQNFTIHGLWPQKNDGSELRNCDVKITMPDQILDNMRQKLLEYWPNLQNQNNWNKCKDFWKGQWTFHGTCSLPEFDQQRYLDTAINRKNDYDLLNDLDSAGIKPDGTAYDPIKICEAVKGRTTKVPIIKCFKEKSSGNVIFHEIHLCINDNGQDYQDCEKLTQCKYSLRGCPRNIKAIFPPMPPPSPPSVADYLQEAWDSKLEDAAELKLK